MRNIQVYQIQRISQIALKKLRRQVWQAYVGLAAHKILPETQQNSSRGQLRKVGDQLGLVNQNVLYKTVQNR